MKITYVVNARIPTEKAHGAQIMKACESLVRLGNELSLFVPRREKIITEDPFFYYGIIDRFSITYVWTLDLVRYGVIGFLIQTFSFAFATVFRIKKESADVIYGRDERVLLILSLFSNTPIIWESHDGVWNIPARLLASRAQGLVVVSNGAKAMYIKRGIPADKIHVAPNGIDLSLFENTDTREEARERLGLPQDQKIALYVGRLDGWKGVGTLLEASKLLSSDIQVAIIGGEKEEIERLKATYPKVLFLGSRPFKELHNNQVAGDVLIVPNTARSEISTLFTSPLKLIAHLASHRPIIATDLPSIREIVGEDEVYFVAPDNERELARGIETLLKDSKLGASLAEQAFQKVHLFDWGFRGKAIVSFIEKRLQEV